MLFVLKSQDEGRDDEEDEQYVKHIVINSTAVNFGGKLPFCARLAAVDRSKNSIAKRLLQQ